MNTMFTSSPFRHISRKRPLHSCRRIWLYVLLLWPSSSHTVNNTFDISRMLNFSAPRQQTGPIHATLLAAGLPHAAPHEACQMLTSLGLHTVTPSPGLQPLSPVAVVSSPVPTRAVPPAHALADRLPGSAGFELALCHRQVPSDTPSSCSFPLGVVASIGVPDAEECASAVAAAGLGTVTAAGPTPNDPWVIRDSAGWAWELLSGHPVPVILSVRQVVPDVRSCLDVWSEGLFANTLGNYPESRAARDGQDDSGAAWAALQPPSRPINAAAAAAADSHGGEPPPPPPPPPDFAEPGWAAEVAQHLPAPELAAWADDPRSEVRAWALGFGYGAVGPALTLALQSPASERGRALQCEYMASYASPVIVAVHDTDGWDCLVSSLTQPLHRLFPGSADPVQRCMFSVPLPQFVAPLWAVAPPECVQAMDAAAHAADQSASASSWLRSWFSR